MSKITVLKLWNDYYGTKEEIYDYSGRLMKKSAIGNKFSCYEPTIDHIRPTSKGGYDVVDNMVLCNRITNQEKNDNFNSWKTNGNTFQAVKVRGETKTYKIQQIL